MLNRRQLLNCLGGSLALASVSLASTAQAQIERSPALLERLLVGLKVKTNSDRVFVARVVKAVQEGKLPLKLVDSTFFWARKKAARNRYTANNPMIYFRPGMEARAKKLGIDL